MRTSMRILVGAAIAVLSLVAATPASGAPCDATGTWSLSLRWEGKRCDPDEADNVTFVVVRDRAGGFRVRDGDASPTSTLAVIDSGNGCRLDREWDLNAVAYGTPAWSRYLFHLDEEGGVVRGTGIFHKLGDSLDNHPSCKRRFTVTGNRIATVTTTTQAQSPSVIIVEPNKPSSATPPQNVPAGTNVYVAPPTTVVTCPTGQAITPDTSGHCCWAGQAWSSSRASCIGVPTSCPTGLKVAGERCVLTCLPGQVMTSDTHGHCCWPGQAWAASRASCIGIPTSCPASMHVTGEQCVLNAASTATTASTDSVPMPSTHAAAASPATIADVFRAHDPAVYACYRDGVTRHPGLAGGLELALHVNSDGVVTTAEARNVTLPDQATVDCIVGNARGWQFPKQRNGAEVSFPYTFAQKR